MPHCVMPIFSGAELMGADLSGALMTRVNLQNSNLSGADLTEVDLFGADLEGASLDCLLAPPRVLPEGYMCERDDSCGEPGRFRIVELS